jgi:hypothetical protein
MAVLHVFGFAGVGLQVVKLHGRQRLFVGRAISLFAPTAAAGAKRQFPPAFAHRETSADAVMHNMAALNGFATQCGQKTEAVFGGGFGQRRACDFGAGRHNVA